MSDKFWMVYSPINDGKLERFSLESDARHAAARKAHSDQNGNPVYVLESIGVVQRPIPDVVYKDLRSKNND